MSRDVETSFRRVGLEPRNINGKPTVILGDFVITFYNYYFVVSGPVPLHVAEELYAIEPTGRTDIRSGGDCGCRPPSTWAVARNAKKIVVNPEETAKVDEGVKQGSSIYTSFADNPKYQLCRSNNEYVTFPKFVDTYHIDSELGLYIFLQILKKHKLI